MMTSHEPPPAGALSPPLLAALTLIALIPLVPRPTFDGAVLIAPLIVLSMGYVLAMQWLSSPPHEAEPGPLPPLFLGLLVAATTLYAGRVIWTGKSDEYPYVISRVLLVIFVICMCALARSAGLERLLKALAVGLLILAVLVLLIGVTGLVFLEAPRPGRTFGVQIPFYKTSGVPRSYGEQGILLTIGLSGLLAYWPRLAVLIRVTGVGAVLVVLLMGQSRNMLLTAVVVVLTWLLVVRSGRWMLMRVALVLGATATLIVDRTLPALQRIGLGEALIGEGVFERNISVRFTLVEGAIDLISSSPSAVLFVGLNHADWNEAKYGLLAQGAVDQETGVHNHFAASVLFLGMIGALASLYALYFGPASRIIGRLSRSGTNRACPADEFALLALMGTLVALNFYEGFFSLAVALVVGVLWSRASIGEGSRPSPRQRAPRGGGDHVSEHRVDVDITIKNRRK